MTALEHDCCTPPSPCRFSSRLSVCEGSTLAFGTLDRHRRLSLPPSSAYKRYRLPLSAAALDRKRGFVSSSPKSSLLKRLGSSHRALKYQRCIQLLSPLAQLVICPALAFGTLDRYRRLSLPPSSAYKRYRLPLSAAALDRKRGFVSSSFLANCSGKVIRMLAEYALCLITSYCTLYYND
jgi:hypothetical protein